MPGSFFVDYIALGDSISIDDYPRRESGRSGLGASSLFHRNDDTFWPAFSGRDLSSLFPHTRLIDLAADGATTEDVLKTQLPRLERGPSIPEAIVTITAGGNDLLENVGAPDPSARLVESIVNRLRHILDEVRARIPGVRLLLGTIYDPSDGTGILNGEHFVREAQWLEELNRSIRNMAAEDDRLALIDIHRHFLGHGITVPERDRWYWSGSIIEPNARGASEVRRLWLESVGR